MKAARKAVIATPRSVRRVRAATTRSRWFSSNISKDAELATLPDGRRIGFRRYGAANGTAVFYLHGGEGSGIEGAIFEPPASKLGVSIIAPDRAGIGTSSPQSNRSILDHAKDLMSLADALDFRQYRVIGVRLVHPSSGAE